MTAAQSQPSLLAKEQVKKWRQTDDAVQLAEALEGLAAALLQEVDLAGAAGALEEAAALWTGLKAAERQGTCLLLAASTCRLTGDMAGAKRNLDQGRAADLPRRLHNGLEVEWCEQELANGHYDIAYQGFTHILDHLAGELEPAVQAQMYQRRAVAAVAAHRNVEAADDFLTSAQILREQGIHAEAEASTLAAAALLAEHDPEAAERVMADVLITVPADGAAATRRGLVGGKVAIQIGVPTLALKRFDEARQGALDVGDPVSYGAAAIDASHAAEAMGEFAMAYERLATAWATLSDILEPESAAHMIRPELEGLRERIGTEQFAVAKQQYERNRRTH